MLWKEHIEDTEQKRHRSCHCHCESHMPCLQREEPHESWTFVGATMVAWPSKKDTINYFSLSKKFAFVDLRLFAFCGRYCSPSVGHWASDLCRFVQATQHGNPCAPILAIDKYKTKLNPFLRNPPIDRHREEGSPEGIPDDSPKKLPKNTLFYFCTIYD